MAPFEGQILTMLNLCPSSLKTATTMAAKIACRKSFVDMSNSREDSLN